MNVSCKLAINKKTIFYDKLHLSGEHQYELMDFVAAKFYEESGVFKLLVSY